MSPTRFRTGYLILADRLGESASRDAANAAFYYSIEVLVIL